VSGLIPLIKLILDAGVFSPVAPTTVKTAYKENKLSKGFGLFEVGPITSIPQSFSFPEFGIDDATTLFIKGGLGLPKEKKGTGGRF
jgi:hypothetical protein